MSFSTALAARRAFAVPRARCTDPGEWDVPGELEERISRALTGEAADKAVLRIRKLERDAAMSDSARRVLEFASSLPWERQAGPFFDRERARRELDSVLAGDAAVKNELLGVMDLLHLATSRGAKKAPGPILLAGPPGTGKTTVASALASATARPLATLRLGGLIDPQALRGVLDFYASSAPGLVLRAICEAGVRNPVVLLDEIDKMAPSTRGRPDDVLLGLLDTATAGHFTDDFVGIPFDLSEVIWIATANDAFALAPPLRDRLRIVEIPGYDVAQRRDIVRRSLIPRALAEAGLGDSDIVFGDDAVEALAGEWPHRTGMREAVTCIQKVLEAAAAAILREETPVGVDRAFVRSVLGEVCPEPATPPAEDLRSSGAYL